MGNPILKRVSEGEFKGWLNGEVLEGLPPAFFEDPFSSVQTMKGELIKESTWRKAALFSLPEGRRIFIKRDRTKGFAESIKYILWSSKAQKEFRIASQLVSKGLNVPRPVGWIERIRKGRVQESYYFSEAVGTGVSLLDEPEKSKDRHRVVELAKTVKKFQDAGLFHRDLHGGNFLWQEDSYFLTDLHRAKIVKSLSLDRRLWNLSHLFHSLRSTWGEEEQVQFLNQYFERKLKDSQEREILRRRVYPEMENLLRRQWRSRTKRCLKPSSEFTLHHEEGIQYFHRRDFPLDLIKRVVEKHEEIVEQNPVALIKYSPEVNVSVLDEGGERVCVKQFCTLGWRKRIKEYFLRPKGRKAWLSANGLRVRGVPSLKAFALVERRKRGAFSESFFLMEAAQDDLEMDRYILKGYTGFGQKRLFIKMFAQWLDGLHKMRLYHRDMKTCNIFVSGNGQAWKFHLLDFEDLMMDKTLNRRRLFRNLLQLNTSTPRVMTKNDRLRFFKEYIRLNPFLKDRKVFLRRLIEKSRRRGLVYVSPRGVVSEPRV